jgi:hypothetical protein
MILKRIKNSFYKAALIGLSFVLAGCSSAQTQTSKESQEEEVLNTYTPTEVVENAVYFAPENATETIAGYYDALTAALPKALRDASDFEEEEEDEDDKKSGSSSSSSKVEYTLKELKALYEKGLTEDVAKAAVQTFAADFFTLINKSDGNDVGGLDYIPSECAADFKEYASFYYYNNYSLILAKYGEAYLPNVTAVNIESCKKVEAEYQGYDFDGYQITISLEYAPVEWPDEQAAQAYSFKTKCKCTIIEIEDEHYVDVSDVTSDKDAGDSWSVFRIIALED